MCLIEVEDTENIITCVAFPSVWAKLKGNVYPGDACLVEGKIDDRGQLLLEDLILLDDLENNAKKYVNIKFDVSNIQDFLRPYMKNIADNAYAMGSKCSVNGTKVTDEIMVNQTAIIKKGKNKFAVVK